MRQSAWKVTLIDLAREFESIETFPRLSQLLGENGGESHKKTFGFMMLGKKMLNDESLEGNVVISRNFYEQVCNSVF